MGDEMSLQILGALIDVPQLFRDPAVEAALSVLDGDTALAAYAMRRAGCDETSLHGDEFLALLPRSIHAFAAGRLALPLFETAAEAKGELLENARKLKRLTLSRENAASMERLHRADVQGDVAQEDALLREFARRAREKLGLG
jgi:DNA primase